MKKCLVLMLTLYMPLLGCAAEKTERQLTLEVTVPDGGWGIAIEEVYEFNDEILVISKLTRTAGMAAQVISKVSDTVTVKTKDLPVRHVVLGKTWGWENKEPYTFVKSRADISRPLTATARIYKRSAKTNP